MHSQGRGLSQDGGCEPQGKDKDENKDCGHQVDAVAIAGRKLSHHERKLAQAAAVAAVGRKLSHHERKLAASPKRSGRKLAAPPVYGRKLAAPPAQGRKLQGPPKSGRKLTASPASGRKLSQAGIPGRGGRKLAEVGFLNNDADNIASG